MSVDNERLAEESNTSCVLNCMGPKDDESRSSRSNGKDAKLPISSSMASLCEPSSSGPQSIGKWCGADSRAGDLFGMDGDLAKQPIELLEDSQGTLNAE